MTKEEAIKRSLATKEWRKRLKPGMTVLIANVEGNYRHVNPTFLEGGKPMTMKIAHISPCSYTKSTICDCCKPHGCPGKIQPYGCGGSGGGDFHLILPYKKKLILIQEGD